MDGYNKMSTNEVDILGQIYLHLCTSGDISYKESDVVYRIVKNFFEKPPIQHEKWNALRDAIAKWYEKVNDNLSKGKDGVFAHTIPLGNLTDFDRYGDTMLVSNELASLMYTQYNLKDRTNLVILRDKKQLDAFGGNIPKTLLIKKLKNDNEFSFRFLRADTLRRLGNFVRISFDGANKNEFDIACAYRYRMEEANSVIDRMAQIYAAVFLTFEEKGIKFLTCNNKAGHLYRTFSNFYVFADERDADRVEAVLKTAHYIAGSPSLKGAIKEFSEEDQYLFSHPAEGIQSLNINDPAFRKLVELHITQFFPEREVRNIAEEDAWLDVIR